MMEKKFILAVTEHRVAGFVFLPYIAEKQDKTDFYILVERITNDDIRKRANEFNDAQKKVVKLIEEYSDSELVKLFSKKKITSQEFLSGLNPELLNTQIRPYIERRLIKITELIAEHSLDLFYKDSPKQVYISDKITISTESAEAVFNFIKTPEEFKYFLSINHNHKERKLTNQPGIILVNEPCHLLLNNDLLTFKDIDGKKLTPFFKNEFVKVPKAREEEYLEKFVINTIKKFKVNCTGFKIEEDMPTPSLILALEGDLAYEPVFRLSFNYQKNRIFNAGEKAETLVSLDKTGSEYTFYKTVRNKNFEEDIISFLTSLGLQNDNTAFFRVPASLIDSVGDKLYNTVCWLNIHNKSLENKNFVVTQDFFDKKYYINSLEIQTSFKTKDDWFDVYSVVVLEGFEIPFIRFRKNILEEKREFTLPDGRIIVLPEEWFAKYSDMFYFGKVNGDNLSFRNYHLKMLNNTPLVLNKGYQEAFMRLVDSENVSNAQIPLVNATLRPYQTEGVGWMYWLFRNNMGACLADDMGLGKTLQTLVMLKKAIESFKNEAPEQKVPAILVVLPASLVHNWYNEIQKFTPEFQTLKYIGTGRSIEISELDNYNIVLTTYGVVRNEFEYLSAYNFLYIILDESQTIKNPDSKIFQAITELNSTHKLVLTGTPIENSLTDLWSQIEFINPGLLGDLNYFKHYFAYPIEKEDDEAKRDRLKRLIQPFILRRTKKEVATDLPDLTEQVMYCSMSESQKNFYEEEKSKVRNEIIQSIDELGVEKSTMVVLNALTRLRQIANHPVMVDTGYEFDSGKFEEVTLSLENMAEENHKVLIFSSFVKHLELFKKFFEEKNFKYSMLTGQTHNREEVVRDFQEKEDISFFLISLKAGGVGLNLTAADYVFILDPWWNPAAELQAINRAHRIGQTNNVFVYRFISAETVEEKIIKLQERKSELAEVFINSNNPFKSLSKENIMDLFD
jgi:superfamily II DNA or RNA helicase